MINFDHAATTPLRKEVLEAMLPYLTEQYANASGTYAAARQTRSAIDRARRSIAEAIGAEPGEIYLTSGGTEADNWALVGALRASNGRRRIVTTKIEHHAILSTCAMLEAQGVEVVYLNVDREGRVDCCEAEREINTDTLLVSVMLANNEVGTIEPVAEIAQIAHANGALMHTDAVQAVGHIPVDLHALGVDLLSLSAHKFGGPKGVGALAVRSGIRMQGLILGGSQERSLRAGTENTPGIVGMGESLRMAVKEMEEASRYTRALRDNLAERLLSLPGVRLNGSRTERLPGNAHFTIENQDSSLLLARLDMAGIAASAGSACTSGITERSHVLRAMFPDETESGRADLRLTLGADNTPEEIESACAVLNRILGESKESI
ncbi:MAG: aminotransferase class V-fold PLP-dependent enzyme [Clostridiales bacterium]|nr:aminotransferase class V-fold PLP-dependent enzyme [Clostridiales bacterium]MDY5513880.1 aminotransferase class V-fold PLP-dependent enzyme [Candidatus Ventricola sp.]